MSGDEFPKSRNISTTRTSDGRFIVTAAAWDGTGHGDSYEIGIRDTSTKDFKLLQASWNEDQVGKAAFAVSRLLEAGMFMHDIAEIFP